MSDASKGTAESSPSEVRYQPLVIALAAGLAGIVADRWLGWPVAVWSTAAVAAWILWLVLWRREREQAAAVVLLVSVAASGAAWHHLQWSLFADDDLGCYARADPGPACVEAVAIKGPRRAPAPPPDPMRLIPRGDQTRLELEVRRVRHRAGWLPASGRARLTVDGHLLGVHAGDRLRIFARLAAFHPPHNPGEFDSAAHNRADRRRSRLWAESPDCVTVVRHAQAWNPSRWLDHLRSEGQRLLRRYLDDRRSSLAAAVLLGARDELDPERPQAFMETGTVHLLAISGLHVGIVAGALFLLMRLVLVPRKRAVVVVAVLTVLYTLLTDARPPATRAMILVLVFCASTYLGRRPLSFNSLAAAALVVLVLNPADLFRTGVHLSFLAVAGLMWFAPQWTGPASRPDSFERMLVESRTWPARVAWAVWRGLRHLFLVSALIWLLTMPLVMAKFHLFTPVAIVLNTLLWIPMVIALVSGFGVLVSGWLLPPVAAVLGWCCDGSLWLLESCIDVARAIPGSHFWVPGPADWWLLGFYGGLGVLAAFPAVRPPRRWCLGLLAAWSAVGFGASALRSHHDRLDCTFLSVGHGAAIVLRLPSGQTMLYDAGQFSSPEIGARSIAACLWSQGITHLDAVVLSHSDADHYNTLPKLLERFSVGVIYVSPVMFQEENPAMAALQEAIRGSGVPLREIFAGDRLRGGEECSIEVLHPPRKGVLGGDNANSVVLGIEYRGHRVLLPGDLESPGLDHVLAEEPWDCDVLLAPHHGSQRSDPPGLAAWSTPEWVVISGDLRWDPGQTIATYRAAGAEVLHTARQGAIHVTLDASGVKTRTGSGL